MRVLIARTKNGRKEEVEVEFDALLEEIIAAVKAVIDRQFAKQQKEESCRSKG